MPGVICRLSAVLTWHEVRLGKPKQLACLNGETLLDRAIQIAKAADCMPIVVVLGAFEELIRSQCNLQEVIVVSNPDWGEGMGASLACGVRTLGETEGALVMTCDMPAVTADHLRALASSGALRASSYANRKGVPAFFPSALFAQLRDRKGDSGARDLLKSAEAIELKQGELDIDTPEDLALAHAAFD
jgi:molybdenum cofactor cytidylyltransferase